MQPSTQKKKMSIAIVTLARACQGLAIGNGFIDPLTLQRYSFFVREVGLVNDRTADFMKHLESTITEFIKAEDMLKAYAVSLLTYLQ